MDQGVPTRPAAFADLTRQLMADCRSSAAALLSATGSIGNAAEAARRLGIDRKLAWNLQRLANVEDPLLALEHLPGALALKRLLRAASRAKVEPQAIDRFAGAVRAVHSLRLRAAPHRATLQGMFALASGSALGAAEVLVEQRRAASRALAALWGVHASVQIRVNFLVPGEADGTIDLIDVFGFVRLSCFRHPMRWSVGLTRSFGHDGQFTTPARRPLDPEAHVATGAPLIGAFSTRPARVVLHPSVNNSMQILAADWPIGLDNAIDLILGEYTRGIGAAFADAPGEQADLNTVVSTPCDVFLHDVMIHRSIWNGQTNPKLTVFNELSPMPPYPAARATRLRLPHAEQAIALGAGLGVAFHPLMPHHARLLDWSCSQVGRSIDEFNLYRLTVPDPAIPARYSLELPLPQRAEAESSPKSGET